MDWLVAIEVALGLSLVYLLAAMGVTALNEAIAAMADSRAKWLRRGVAALMSSDARDVSLQAADAVYATPYLSYLGQGVKGTRWWHLLSPRFEASYIGAWTLMQGALASAAEGRRVTLASVADIRAAAARLDEHVPLRAVLEDLCARAGDDMAAFRTLLDQWFTTFEAQVGSWYRQKTHLVVMVLSLGVAVLLNLDTIAMVRQLSTDKATRARLVDVAVEAAKKPTAGEAFGLGALDQALAARDGARDRLDTLDRSAAAGAAGAAPDPAQRQPLVDALAEAERRLAELRAANEARLRDATASLGAAGLNFGWSGDDLQRLLPPRGLFNAEWLRALLLKLAGLIVSAGAISLGAPFWFDLLKRVVAIRAVGLNLAEKAQRQAAAAPKDDAG